MTVVAPTSAGPFTVESYVDGEVPDRAGWPRHPVPDSFYLTPEWVGSQDGAATATPVHIVLRAPEDGSIAAVLPCYLLTSPDQARPDNAPRVLLNVRHPRDLAAALPADEADDLVAHGRALHDAGVLGYPALVATAPNAFLFGYTADRRHPADVVEAALVTAFEALADRLGAVTRAFWYVRPELFPGLAALLADRGYLGTLVNADCGLDVRWPDFDGYLAALPRRMRPNVRREVRDFADHGLRVEVRDGTALDLETAELHAELQQRYRIPTDPSAVLAGFQRENHRLGERMRVMVAESGARRLGFALLFEHDGVLYARHSGFPRGDGAKTGFVYFNTLYYAVIRYALAHGIRRIEYGTGSYEAKRHRGATVRPLVGYLRSTVADGGQLAGYLARYENAVGAYVRSLGAGDAPLTGFARGGVAPWT